MKKRIWTLCMMKRLKEKQSIAAVINAKLIRKVLGVRLWSDPEDGSKWKKSVTDLGYEILVISQFTLFGSVSKGSKPSFNDSMKSDTSRPFFEKFVDCLKSNYSESKIKTGAFGEYMQVYIQNDGPVTLEIDSRKFNYSDE